MADSASTATSNANPTTNGPSSRPAGAPPRMMRRPQNADPLRRPKKRLPPKKPTTTPVKVEATTTAAGVPVDDKEDPSTYTEFRLVTTKASILANMRYHCMKFQSKRNVSLGDPTEFTRPVRLHRRDPRAPLQGGARMGGVVPQSPEPEEDEMDPEERAKREAAQAAKEALQKENLAKIAPHGGAVKQKKNMFKKKTQQVFQQDETEKKLRYEEYFPWMLEDFDNKNTWVGNLEGALSTSSVMLVSDKGMFKMIPVEKYYRFQQRNIYKTLTMEEAEAALKKQERVSRWFMDITKMDEKAAKADEEKQNLKASKRLFTVKGDRLEGREGKAGFTDADELDFEEDFADDEEAPIMDGDEEENKDIAKKMKREQLSANIFDVRNEKDFEKEELERRKLEIARKAHGKKVKKALKSREKNFAYDDSDSDKNPYASSDESVDTEEEESIKKDEEEKKKAAEKAVKDKEEEKRKEKEQELQMIREAKESLKSLKSAAASGTSTPLPQSGTSTSSATLLKVPAADNKSKSLKRSGSPGVDSGNESSHTSKKLKAAADTTQQSNGSKSAVPSSSSESPKGPVVTLRLTPENPNSAPNSSKPDKPGKTSKPKKRPAPGSGSDVDTGAEMSDAGSGGEKGTKKLKLRVGAGGQQAQSNRAGSPSNATSTIATGKIKSGSPSAKTSRAGSPAASDPNKPITAEEIKNAITADGISSSDLIAKFRSRIKAHNKAEFFSTLKTISKWAEIPGRGKVFYINNTKDSAATTS